MTCSNTPLQTFHLVSRHEELDKTLLEHISTRWSPTMYRVLTSRTVNCGLRADRPVA